MLCVDCLVCFTFLWYASFDLVGSDWPGLARASMACFGLEDSLPYLISLLGNLLVSTLLELARFVLGLFGFLLTLLYFFCFALLALFTGFAWFG